MAATFFLCGRGERNACAPLASPHLRHHLDWPALLFQPRAHSRDEAVRSPTARQDLSETDAGGNGLVPRIFGCDRSRWSEVFHDSPGIGRKTCRQSLARLEVAWLVGLGMDARVFLCLQTPASCKGTLEL